MLPCSPGIRDRAPFHFRVPSGLQQRLGEFYLLAVYITVRKLIVQIGVLRRTVQRRRQPFSLSFPGLRTRAWADITLRLLKRPCALP